MNRNFQPEIHPDADQLSVFVEGAATAREQERMLAHLAECAECRKAVFLMQPHAELQRVVVVSAKGWQWQRLLLPVGLPAAVLACALVAVMIHIRTHGTSGTPQQIASVRQAEAEHPGTTPTGKSAPKPSTNSEQVAGSGRRQKTFAPKATGTKLSRQENPVAGNQPTSKNEESAANVAGAAPSVVGGPFAATTRVSGGISSEKLQQLQPADTPRAGGNQAIAGVVGTITDPTGAAVPNAKITVTSAETGLARQVTSTADGQYVIPDLNVGKYNVAVEAPGFKKVEEDGIALNVDDRKRFDFKLMVGSASEQVTVEATTQGVQTDSSEVSSVVSSQQVSKLATNGRSTYTLVNLAPVPITVSHGKRFLSLDDAGDLLVSRDGGKKWKKVKSQWAGKVVHIELIPPYKNETAQNAKSKSGSASHRAIFQLTTDSGAVWISKDGAHWRRQ